MSTLDKFRTKRGDLSRYALACGYVQHRARGLVRYALWHEGGPCYHVRATGTETRERVFWHSTPSLTEARRVFRTGKLPEDIT